MTTQEIYGRRDKKSDMPRYASMAALVVVILTLEITVGSWQRERAADSIKLDNQNWAIAKYKYPYKQIDVPVKKKGQVRVVYISNSHAMTGGHVANHLSTILEHDRPGTVEVLDISDPGIFAPDILQRTLQALDFDPDVIVMAVAYISFSDRMNLALQAHTARSFFNSGVREKLPAGFWWRNYDLGIYGETLFSQQSDLYRFRNKIRDTWELPFVDKLRSWFGQRSVLFLSSDEDQRWKFPEGYDNNLFQWHLYSIGRRNHLADLQSAVQIASASGVPVIGINLPIDWDKSVYKHQAEDIVSYRASLARIFSAGGEYLDYQDIFPKEFSTYDALHPNWHGARLHALDLSLRLHERGLLPREISDAKLLASFFDVDQAVSQAYRQALNGNYPFLRRNGFRRLDPSEPENARKLLQRLASYPLGSLAEINFLFALSLRTRYWQDSDFSFGTRLSQNLSAIMQRALQEEIRRAKTRLQFFMQRLRELQNERLKSYPLPDMQSAQVAEMVTFQPYNGVTVYKTVYRGPDANLITVMTTKQGNIIAYEVQNNATKQAYRRVDVFGDGSFLLIQTITSPMIYPSWVIHTRPYARFGI